MEVTGANRGLGVPAEYDGWTGCPGCPGSPGWRGPAALFLAFIILSRLGAICAHGRRVRATSEKGWFHPMRTITSRPRIWRRKRIPTVLLPSVKALSSD